MDNETANTVESEPVQPVAQSEDEIAKLEVDPSAVVAAMVQMRLSFQSLVAHADAAASSIDETLKGVKDRAEASADRALLALIASAGDRIGQAQAELKAVVTASTNAMEAARQRLLEESSEVALSAEQRREYVKRYMPGTVDRQAQEILALSKERDEARKAANDRLTSSLDDQAKSARILIELNHLRENESAVAIRERALVASEQELQDIRGIRSRLSAAELKNRSHENMDVANRMSLDEANELRDLRSKSSQWRQILADRTPEELMSERSKLLGIQKDLSARVDAYEALEAKLESTLKEYSMAIQRIYDAHEGLSKQFGTLLERANEELQAPMQQLDRRIELLVDERVRVIRDRSNEVIDENKGLVQENRSLLRDKAKDAGRFEGILDIEGRIRQLKDHENHERDDALWKLEQLRDRQSALDESVKSRSVEVEKLKIDAAKAVADLRGAESERDAILRDCAGLRAEKLRLESHGSTHEERKRDIDAIDGWPLGEEFVTVGIDRVSDEAGWLNRVCSEIKAKGFNFDRRLVDSFHTALKCSEIAPLTVLAGVSGTGKSELPRLYSRAGGFRHLMVSVKPDWDSPQALWGHYDYLAGAFQPTDTLRSWAASQREGATGFQDGMLLILLDEMNLARTELYLSDLLSRLESRRGRGEERLSIGLGARCEAYHLRLGTNVLIVGTMNEDETTHALSDKVLDRGNVIRFPRPSELASRGSYDLPAQERWISGKMWEGWKRSPDDLPTEVRTGISNQMTALNGALSEVRRAIGHRVFQATEYYMANHPAMAECMGGNKNEKQKTNIPKWAEVFADQFEQRLVPKLRGIDASSISGRRCLDRVREVLKQLSVDRLDRALQASIDGSKDGPFEWNDSASQ